MAWKNFPAYRIQFSFAFHTKWKEKREIEHTSRKKGNQIIKRKMLSKWLFMTQIIYFVFHLIVFYKLRQTQSHLNCIRLFFKVRSLSASFVRLLFEMRHVQNSLWIVYESEHTWMFNDEHRWSSLYEIVRNSTSTFLSLCTPHTHTHAEIEKTMPAEEIKANMHMHVHAFGHLCIYLGNA